jgi:hypothetical protein
MGVGSRLGLGVVIAALGLAAMGCSGVEAVAEEGATQEKVGSTSEGLYNGFLGDLHPGTPSVVKTSTGQVAIAANQQTTVVSKFDRATNNVNWTAGQKGSSTYNTIDRPMVYLKSNTAWQLQSHKTNGGIFEANSGTQVNANTPETPNGSPSVFVRHDGINCSYWVNNSGWIVESFWDGTQWISNNFNAIGLQFNKATTSPMAYVRPSNPPSSTVLYGCGQADFCELVLSNGSWHEYKTTGKFHNFKAGTRPVGFAPSSVGGWHIVANTTSGLETVAGRPDGGYGNNYVLDSDQRYVGSPMVYVRSDGASTIIANWYNAGTSRIYEFNKPGNAGWSPYHLIYQYSGASYLSEPFPFVTKEGYNSLLIQDANNRLLDVRETYPGSNVYDAPKFLTW